MKRFMMLVALIMGLLFVSCESSNETKTTNKLAITSPSEVQLGKYGETITITYTGTNDELAEVTINSEWLRASQHEVGTLTVNVADNESEGSRMAAITLSHNGATASVVISQSNEATLPIITSLSGQEMELKRAGTIAIIEYQLENTNPVDYVYAKTDAEWIYSIDTKTEGCVKLGVSTNTTKALRETVVTVGYGAASFNITLKQLGDGESAFTATVMSGEYYGDSYTPGIGNYFFTLSDRGFDAEGKGMPSATYYRIDAYGDVYTGYDSFVPIANGTYTFDPENTYAKGTFTAEYSGFWVTNKDGKRNEDITTFESGTMVVENGKITLDVVIGGEAHHVEYVGSTSIADAQGSVTILSTLDGDLEADLSNHTMIYECYGDYYEFGYTNWMFKIVPNGNSGDGFQFDFITGYTTPEEGFIGEYIASDFLATNSFIPGWTDGYAMLCSWYFNAEQTEVAPFRGGKMSIKDNGDGTVTIDIDVTDDLRNRITGTWTGVPQANKN